MRRSHFALLLLAGVLVALAGLLTIGAPRVIGRRLSATTGLDVRVGSVRVAWEDHGVALHDVIATGPSGEVLVRGQRIVLPVSVLMAPGSGTLDGVRGDGVSALGAVAEHVRAPRLRVRADEGTVAIDGTIVAASAVVSVRDGRMDLSGPRLRAEHVDATGVELGGDSHRLAMDARRVVLRRSRLGAVHVDRLIADDVRAGAPPRRLRALVREAEGTVRVRWSATPARLDVRADAFPVLGFLGQPFRDADLSGGLVRGVLRLGRRPGMLDGRVRIGATRLARDGEPWLGWEGLTATIDHFDVHARRMVAARVAMTEPVVVVHRDERRVWPFGGWDAWLDPATVDGIVKGWRSMVSHVEIADGTPGADGETVVSITRGTLTLIDDVTEPTGRLVLRDVAGRVRYARDTEDVDMRLEGRLGDAATLTIVTAATPSPHARLAVHGLSTDALAAWRSSGATVLGVPFGRVLELAGMSVLDFEIDVPGDGREKRFGLVSKTLRALIEEMQDRVTLPLLASAEERSDAGMQSLDLPIVAVNAQATGLSPEAAEVADRVAVLLAQFPDLGVRLEGRAAPDEPIEVGATRVDLVRARLVDLGVGDRVEVGATSAGTPGVVIVVTSG